MLVFLFTEAVELLYALGKVSYNSVIWLYRWYFQITPEEHKRLEMKDLKERIELLEMILEARDISNNLPIS